MESPRPNRQARRLAATRKQILEAAAALIAERGFEATTVEDIAERADVAKGTLYYHFTSKEEMAVALSRADLARSADGVEDALAGGASPIQVLREVLQGGAAWIEAHPELARVAILHVLRGGQTAGQEGGQDGDPAQPHVRAIFRRILAAGQAAQELRSDTPIEVLHAGLTGAYLHTVCLWLFAGAGFPLADRLLECLALFLEGAQAKRG